MWCIFLVWGEIEVSMEKHLYQTQSEIATVLWAKYIVILFGIDFTRSKRISCHFEVI